MRQLRRRHWVVMRYWEHEVINSLPRLVARISAALEAVRCPQVDDAKFATIPPKLLASARTKKGLSI